VKRIDTDVLVVGGGLAALRAAYDALGAGARVTLAVKGKAGRSGSSAMTSAGYSAAFDSADDSPEQHYLDTLAGGKGINDARLARIMTEEGPQKLRELEAMGAPLAYSDSGERLVNPSGDHSRARVFVAANHTGRDFTDALAAAVVARGCQLLEMTAVLDVLTAGGEVAGAVGLDYENGDLLVIAAPAVILGTGGAGRLFSVTSNPNDATGDGYALALAAGADLRDMEFIQFYPWRCIIPFERSRMPIQPSTFVLGGKLWNSEGERFMLAYDPVRAEHTTRDVAARGIYDQIHAGKDVKGGVRLDLSEVSFEDWLRTNPKPARHFVDRGLDVYREELIIAPEAHFFMGGAVIDEAGRTRVPGLYAVGEAAGGVHGANRIDSNALPETQVFGARAGRAAAARSQRGARPVVDVPEEWNLRFEAARGGEVADEPSPYAGLRKELQRIMWTRLGIVRDGDEMEAGAREVDELARRLEDCRPNGVRDLMHHATLESSITVARCCFTAALTRTESRGAHYRKDFPAQDDASWLLVQHLERGPGGSLVRTVQPVRAAAAAGLAARAERDGA
jgi:fumarate reductase (CoM/CoB) subunit A